ncbi:MAG: gliding motility-associated C-terminal domain-containing protein, partial [Bacteroidota bacterium]|nr:gliding motility-associated C-terminal domain-containing protein [Bacteroidota bacterium]
TYTVPITPTIPDAGNYSVVPVLTGTVLNNYSIVTINSSFTVNKKGLTVLGVVLSRKYKENNPVLSYNIQGFVNGNNIADLDTVPVGSTIATPTSDVGQYSIVYSGGGDNNYTFVYQEGRLNITKASQIITVPGLTARVKTGEFITLSAVASSGLPLSISISDSTIVKANGNVVSGLKDGVATLTLIQAGNINYFPATSVEITIISTSTGVVSVSVLGISGPDTVLANFDATYSLTSKLGFTYKWFYSGKNVAYLSSNDKSEIDVLFTEESTSGYIKAKIFDEFGNLLKEDSIYVTVVMPPSNLDKNSPEYLDYQQKVVAAQLSKQLTKVDCEPTVTDCDKAYVLLFNLGKNISNKSKCSKGGYGNFLTTGKIDTLVMGNSYTMKSVVKNGVSTASYFAIWIDYGNDGSLSDPDDFISASFTADTVFTVKNVVIRNNDAYEGPRRLRVSMRTTGAFTKEEACPSEGTVGETEDYLIFIRKQDALEAPNLITPNDDGKNDLFIIKGINPKSSSKLTIIDRSGNTKFTRESRQEIIDDKSVYPFDNDWNGVDNKGDQLPDGPYFYFFTNGDREIKGFLEIRRK